jgi:hypothetical protein
MVEKCVNPACSARFHSLREGRVFVKEVESDSSADGSGPSRQVRHFWLCESCSHTMTVIAEKGKDVKVVPLSVSATVARAG